MPHRTNLNDDDRRASRRQVKNERARESRKQWKQEDIEMHRIYEQNERRMKSLEKIVDKLSSELKNGQGKK